jgi:RNA-directed DNA polymerase
MSTTPGPQGKAMYVASQLDKSWLLNEQRKLYVQSMYNPDYVFRKLWGLMTDPRNLRIAVARVAQNRGRRTAGVDGITVKKVVAKGVETHLGQIRVQLRTGAYRPSPVRRVLIPKPGQPGKFRPLGIPTVNDRVVQAAVKNILEPIFEGDFYPTSYGFRPGRSPQAAIEHLRVLLRPRRLRKEPGNRLPYEWAIEGDIKACFDRIEHHGLMNRVRRRIGDPKVCRLVLAFLKSGVMNKQQFSPTDEGSPQGGILSPLLANIALSVIDERYERQVWPRRTPTLLTEPGAIARRAHTTRANDRRRRRAVVLFPIRYADDFIILVGVPPGPDACVRSKEAAETEKTELAKLLKEQLNLELSEAKTSITPVTERMSFLGHHVLVRTHARRKQLFSTAVVPKDRSHRLRERIKSLFRRNTIARPLKMQLQQLNWLLRGWANFYRHTWGASRVFSRIDQYVWQTILRWIRKKHRRVGLKRLLAKYTWRKPGRSSFYWRDGGVTCFRMSTVPVERFRLGWMRPPMFALTSAESPVHNERCPPGSGEGTQKPTGASREGR